MLRSDHRYQDSAVSLCRSLPNQIHTELAKIFTTDLKIFVQNRTKINRNWKFIIVTLNVRVQDVKLAANFSANSRYVRGRHLYQTLHITFSCDRLQTVTSTQEGRWWWTCYKPTRLFCVNRNRVFYCLWCFLTRTRASAHRCDEREIENTTSTNVKKHSALT